MDKAFNKLKQLLAAAVTVTLAHPHAYATMFITTDASDSAVGAVLSQTYNDIKTPLQFFLEKAEQCTEEILSIQQRITCSV